MGKAKIVAEAVLLLAVSLSLIGVLSTLSAQASVRGSRPLEQEIEEALTCQCGCGLTVANCNNPNCPFAVPARHRIRLMLSEGKSKVQIIAFFRNKYGEKVLSEPPRRGFNLLAWTMPFVALILGGLGIFFALGRWRGGASVVSVPEDAAANPPDTARFDPMLRRRLEQELNDRK